jgi:hypothetical protein
MAPKDDASQGGSDLKDLRALAAHAQVVTVHRA